MYSAKKISVDESREARVDSPFWDEVGKSPRFVNIVNGEVSLYDTRAAVVWSEEHLLVKYWAQEPFLNGTMMTRDQLLFNENNVELFIDGGDSYYELELSANNIVYEVLFVWRDAFDSDNPRYAGLEPLKNGLTFGGNNDRNSETFWTGDHPRGVRWAFPEWDLDGLHTEVKLLGTINDNTDVDDGWEAMLKIPWASMGVLAEGRSLPPTPGDVWRFQFARYERLPELQTNVGWAWTPVGNRDNHVPEKFTPVTFTE